MKLDINTLIFQKATVDEVDKLIYIIHRCLKEVNSKDYEPCEIEKFLNLIWLSLVFIYIPSLNKNFL